MKFIKPLAYVSAGALALVATIASASSGTSTPAAPEASAADCWGQPNMLAALQHAREARHSLDAAEHNKGGWRDAAIKSADEVIKQTEKGCAAANH